MCKWFSIIGQMGRRGLHHRTAFEVSAIIVAYNSFINSVDRIDQMRVTNTIEIKEMRLHMTIFTYLLDFATLQAFTLYSKIR